MEKQIQKLIDKYKGEVAERIRQVQTKEYTKVQEMVYMYEIGKLTVITAELEEILLEDRGF